MGVGRGACDGGEAVKMEVQGERNAQWPKVAIIILNWNGWLDTLECLESVYQITYPNYNVILVDNGSEDGSIEKIKEYCDGRIELESKFFMYNYGNKPIKIIEYMRYEVDDGEIDGRGELERRLTIIKNEMNYGFADGNNIAIRYAIKALSPEYFLLLNNDTVVDTKFLITMIKVGENDKTIGIVGPIVYDYIEQNRVQSAGVKLRWNTGRQRELRSNERSNEIDSNQFEEVSDVDYVAGCALLVKAELIKIIGYLDPDYFAYWEETDWCIRAKKAGYRVFCVPKSKIWHKGSSTSTKISGFYEYHMTRNMFWFMQQHATTKQYYSFLLYFFGFRFWKKSGIHIIYHRDMRVFIAFLGGVRAGLNKRHDGNIPRHRH